MRVKYYVLIVAMTTMLSGCAYLRSKTRKMTDIKKCEFRLKGVELKTIGLRTLTVGLDIGVKNPNSVQVTVDGLDLEFFVNDKSLFEGTTKQGVSIASRKEKIVPVDISVRYLKAGEALVNAMQDGSVKYKVVGVVHVSTKLARFEFPITLRK